jgi:hypothetical protein
MEENQNKVTNDNRTDFIPNQVIGIYCPSSIEFAMSNKKVWLRYTPKKPTTINITTTE